MEKRNKIIGALITIVILMVMGVAIGTTGIDMGTTNRDIINVRNMSADYFTGDGANITGQVPAANASLTITGRLTENAWKGKCLYVSGAVGQATQVSLCDNTITGRHHIIGLAGEDGVTNDNILVYLIGEIDNLDTDGTSRFATGPAWADGDALYAAKFGNLTTVQPTSGAIEAVGHVARAHGVKGRIIIHTHLENSITTTENEDIFFRLGTIDGTSGVEVRDNNSVPVFNVTSAGFVQARGYNFTSAILGSDGIIYATVQAAITGVGANGWVKVPAGTYTEALTISNDGVTLYGAGMYSTIIDGTTAGHAVDVSGNYVTIRDMAFETTAGGTNALDAVHLTGAGTRVTRVWVVESDRHGIQSGSASVGVSITQSNITNSDDNGISINGAKTMIVGNHVFTSGEFGIALVGQGDDSTVSGNIIDISGDDGINVHLDNENCTIVGNRVKAWTNAAIDDNSGTCTVASNDET